MSRPLWDALRPLLDRALDLDGTERAVFLAELRRDSPTIVATLEQMLSYEGSGLSPRLAHVDDLEGFREYQRLQVRAHASVATSRRLRVWTTRAAATAAVMVIVLTIGLRVVQ
ncbi:MAG: hypothetical protein MUF00_01815 [Gemmatimonadaceae bacterium]|jgi:hypothetical protein|nr:hypothetical protein [Gemmatimonadaceae bacterium]